MYSVVLCNSCLHCALLCVWKDQPFTALLRIGQTLTRRCFTLECCIIWNNFVQWLLFFTLTFNVVLIVFVFLRYKSNWWRQCVESTSALKGTLGEEASWRQCVEGTSASKGTSREGALWVLSIEMESKIDSQQFWGQFLVWRVNPFTAKTVLLSVQYSSKNSTRDTWN